MLEAIKVKMRERVLLEIQKKIIEQDLHVQVTSPETMKKMRDNMRLNIDLIG